jgi:uncharacterized protein (UPF0335 family)
MSESIMDYIKEQEIQDTVSVKLLEQLDYLFSVKESMESEVKEINELITTIINEMQDAGIDLG